MSGTNHVVHEKGTGYAELDYVTLGVPVASDPPASGTTALANPNSGRCLGIAGGSSSQSGAAVQLADCSGGSASQQWRGQPRQRVPDLRVSSCFAAPARFVAVVGQGSGRCLDIQDYDTADGTPVQLWDCSGTWNQQWSPTNSALVNPQSGKCLDVASGGTANGTQVRLWSCNGLGAQQWQFNANGTVTNPESGRCLDAVNQGTANGTLLQIWDCFSGGTQPNQVWNLR